MTKAYIALGSNLDNPQEQLQRALTTLRELPNCTLQTISRFYTSRAVGPGDQPDYLNAVALLHTSLEAETLLHELQKIEQQQGRIRSEHWGPRTLDLDILLFGDLVLETPQLTIPHPRMHLRDFVLYPLREISDTMLTLPGGSDLDTLIEQCPQSTVVQIHDTPELH